MQEGERKVADPLGFFFDEPEEKKRPLADAASPASRPALSPRPPPRQPRQREEASPSSRSRGRSRGGRSCSSSEGRDGESAEARKQKLRRRIEKYIERNRLDHRVSGIMQNMHPSDVVKVMETPFPEDCRNPSGFAVAQIRRTERDVGRPKDYRWNGRTWNQGPQDFGVRSPPGGNRGRPRERDRAKASPGRDRSRRRRHRSRSRRKAARRKRRKASSSKGSRESGSGSDSGSSSSKSDSGSEDSPDAGRRRRR